MPTEAQNREKHARYVDQRKSSRRRLQEPWIHWRYDALLSLFSNPYLNNAEIGKRIGASEGLTVRIRRQYFSHLPKPMTPQHIKALNKRARRSPEDIFLQSHTQVAKLMAHLRGLGLTVKLFMTGKTPKVKYLVVEGHRCRVSILTNIIGKSGYSHYVHSHICSSGFVYPFRIFFVDINRPDLSLPDVWIVPTSILKDWGETINFRVDPGKRNRMNRTSLVNLMDEYRGKRGANELTRLGTILEALQAPR